MLIKALRSDSTCLAQYGHLVNDVQSHASTFPTPVHFSHVRRHCNYIAHSLARRAIRSPLLLVWMEDVPSDFVTIFQG